MTTEDLLWNIKFEKIHPTKNNDYNYSEEWYIEKYHEDKELFERIDTLLKPAI